MDRRNALFALSGYALVLASPAVAQDTTAQRVFSAIERQLILDYYARTATSGGPGRGNGRGRGGGLPPGIQRRLERGGTLPPGIARQVLPPDLSRQLPLLPSTYTRMIVGNDVLLVATATGLILDIIRGAIRG